MYYFNFFGEFLGQEDLTVDEAWEKLVFHETNGDVLMAFSPPNESDDVESALGIYQDFAYAILGTAVTKDG